MEIVKKTYSKTDQVETETIMEETQYIGWGYGAMRRCISLHFSNNELKEKWFLSLSEQEAMRIKNELEKAMKISQ